MADEPTNEVVENEQPPEEVIESPPEEQETEPQEDPQVAFNASILNAVSQLRNEISSIGESIGKIKTPTLVEPEYQDPIEQVRGEVQGLKTLIEKQQYAAQIKELTAQNRDVVSGAFDAVASKNAPFFEAHPKLKAKMLKEIKSQADNFTNSNGRALSPQDTQIYISDMVRDWKEAVGESPANKVAAKEKQVEVNKKAVEMPGGTSPTPATPKPLDADSDEYWEIKHQQIGDFLRGKQ